jgi:hypothetical protein
MKNTYYSNLFNTLHNYTELKTRLLITKRAYKKAVDFLSAYQNKDLSMSMLLVDDIVSVVNEQGTEDISKAAFDFYKCQNKRRLSSYDPKLHKSFQINLKDCYSVRIIKHTDDKKRFKNILSIYLAKWTSLVEIKFSENGQTYFFGLKNGDSIPANQQLIIRQKHNIDKVTKAEWEVVIKPNLKSYDIAHEDTIISNVYHDVKQSRDKIEEMIVKCSQTAVQNKKLTKAEIKKIEEFNRKHRKEIQARHDANIKKSR